jgi:hypothetical protein
LDSVADVADFKIGGMIPAQRGCIKTIRNTTHKEKVKKKKKKDGYDN